MTGPANVHNSNDAQVKRIKDELFLGLSIARMADLAINRYARRDLAINEARKVYDGILRDLAKVALTPEDALYVSQRVEELRRKLKDR